MSETNETTSLVLSEYSHYLQLWCDVNRAGEPDPVLLKGLLERIIQCVDQLNGLKNGDHHLSESDRGLLRNLQANYEEAVEFAQSQLESSVTLYKR